MTKVMLIGTATTTDPGSVHEILMALGDIEIAYGGGTAEYEDVEPRDFVFSAPPELVPPALICDSVYRGKCKKFRKEAR